MELEVITKLLDVGVTIAIMSYFLYELNKKNNLVSQLSDLHESLSTTILSQSDIVQSFPSIVHANENLQTFFQ